MALLSDDDVFGSAGKSNLLSDDDVFGAPKKQGNSLISGIARRVADVPIGLAKGIADLPGAAIGLADIPTNGLVGKAVDSVVNPLGEVADSVGVPKWARPTQLSNNLADLYSPEMKQAKQNVHEAFVQGEQTAKDSGSGVFGQFAGGVASGVPAMLKNPSAALALATENYGGMKAIAKGTAHILGPMAAKYAEAVKAGTMTQEAADAALANAAGKYSAINEGLLTAGQNTQQIENENPNATFADRAMQGVAGAITGGISRGVSKIPGLGDVEANMALREVGAGSKNSFAGSRLAAAGKSALSEGVLEEFPQSIQEQVWQNLATNKPWNEGLSEQAVSGLVAGGGMGAAMGALNGGSGSRYVAGKINTKPNEDQPPIAGLLPSPTYTGTPGGQIVENDAARQADIDAADKNAAELYAMRDAFERSRQNVTLVADPVPVQQRIDAMLGLDADRMDKQGRAQYEKDLAAAFNEPIGVRLDENQNEVPFTMGEYLDAQVRTEDIVRARPLRANANEQSANRLAQIADEESQQHAAIVQDLTQSAAQGGALSQAALTGIQTGATRMPAHPERAAIEQQMLADEAAQAELAPVERLIRTRTDEQVQRIAENENANPKMRQAAIAEIQRRMTAQSQPTTTRPLTQTATQFNLPENVFAAQPAQMDTTPPQADGAQARVEQGAAPQSKGVSNSSGGASDIAKGAQGIAQRQANAANNFIGSVQEQFGLSKEDAGKAWDHFVKNKLVKIDAVGGQYSLTDGRLWDGEVMRQAAAAVDAVSQPKTDAATEAKQGKPFDSKAWDKERDNRIKESKDAGNTHLDQMAPSVESMRGKEIYYVHNPKQRGVIRTVDNRGNVYVHWSDEYSAEKELASETVEDNKSWLKSSKDMPILRVVRDGKTYVMESSLGASDLKDYVFATKAAPAADNTGKPTETRKPKELSRNKIDPAKDTLFQAIAKLGGMDTQELTGNGFDQKDISVRHNGRVIQSGKNKGQLTKPSFKSRSFGFNMPLHKKGGMSFDGMLEALKQYGYFPEGATKNDAIEAFRRELGGDVVVTPDAEMRLMEEDQAARDAEQLAEQEANDAIGYDDLNEREKALVDFHAETVYDEDNPIEAFRRGMKSAGATEEEINEAIKQTFGAQETGNNDSGGTPQGTGETRDAQGADNGLEDGSVQEGAEPDWLTGQTNEQAAEQFAQQQSAEPAAPTKEQADRERDAVPFLLGMQSQPKPQGVQTGLFTADGRASEEAKPTRGEIGASLTKEERKSVLKTLVDVYRQKKAPREMKGVDSNGNERYGYVHSPDLFEKSDITGAMVRYYVTLPDGRIAHPTELFADYTQADIDAAMQKEIDAERNRENSDKFERGRLLSLAAPTINEANGKFNHANRHAEDRDSIVPALLTNGELYLRSRPDSADKAAKLLGDGWRVEAKPKPASEPAKAQEPAAKKLTAEQKIRAAFNALPSITMDKLYPITVEHNGVTRDFIAYQQSIGRGNNKSVIHLATVKRGKLIASDDSGAIVNTFTLDGKDNLKETGMPRYATPEDMKQWTDAGFKNPIGDKPAEVGQKLSGNRRNPTEVNIFNPYEDGDIVTIGGKDWQVRNDGGWYLTSTGNWRGEHPTIKKVAAMTDLIREVEQAATVDAKKEAETKPEDQAAKPAEKIDDFGEKIAGAKKDLWQSYKKAMSDELPADAKDITLSKHFPEPDYENLIASGTDIRAVAAIKAMRDEIPAKPRQPFKLRRWAEQLKSLRGFANSLISGYYSIDYVLSKMREGSRAMSELVDRIELYAELGYPAFKSADGFSVSGGWSTDFDKSGNPQKKDAWAILNGNGIVGTYDNRAQAVDALRDRLAVEPEKSERSIKLDLYKVTSTGDIVIGKKVASNKFIDLKTGFKSAREAREYLKEHESELLELLEKKKKFLPTRRSTNDPRIGKDYRLGEDVTPEKFAAEFGFRGVQFGNYVEQERRAKDLNNAYDALLDLANIIGVPPRAISLNGSLGLAFGARGKGGVDPAAAHYEAGETVINLTKINGAGSLGHEFFHALDNYFSKQRGAADDYLTAKPYFRGEGVRPEVVKAFSDLMKAIKSSDYYKRSISKDKTRSKDYWGTDIELAARAFESYLIAKAEAQGQSNDYLANIISEEAQNVYNEMLSESGLESDPYPYPTKAEQTSINAAFDNLFNTIQTKETDKGIALMEESAVYNVNEPDAFTGDIFQGTEHALPETKRRAIPAGRQSRALADDGQGASRVLAVREAADTPGVYHVSAQLVTVGERQLPVETVNTPQDAARVFAHLSRFAVEHMDGLVTDKNGKPLAIIGSFKGAPTQASAYPSTLMMELARIDGAANLWLSHNHPSGVARLSEADKHLSRSFRQILRDTSVTYRGLSAVARRGETIQWEDDDYNNGEVLANEPAPHRVPIVERELVNSNPINQISGPKDAARIVPEIAKDSPGVVFLTAQNEIASFVPFSPDEMGELRSGNRLMKLFGAAAKSGATGALVAMPDRMVTSAQFGNLKGALGTIDVGVLDGIRYDSATTGSGKSIAESGEFVSSVGPNFFSRGYGSAPEKQVTRQQAESRIKSILGDKLCKVLIESGLVAFTNKGSEYQGATYKDGSIVLNLDALNADNFDGVFAHEGFHSTIRDLVGEQTYAKMMKQLDTMLAMGNGAQWVKDANAAIPSDTKEEHRTEEIAAYSIEQYVNGAKQPSAVKRWVESLLSALRTAIIRRLPMGKLKSWAINNLQPQDLANMAIAGLKAKAQGRLQAQGREAMAFSKDASQKTIVVDGIERPATNSNGKPIAQTEEGLRNFWRWFGDSKVVDADGKPLVVYHGTNADFSEFKTTRGGEFGPAIYFTDSPREAGEYSEAVKGVSFSTPSAHIMPMFVRIENPYTKGVDEFWKEFGGVGSDADGVERAKAAGYDGVIAKRADRYYDNDAREFVDRGNMLTHYIAFDKSQAKSAIGNNGNFDGANPDIRYSRAQIIGDSGRQYDQTQRQFFKNVGRDIEKKNLVDRTTEYLKNDFWKKMAVGIVDQFRGLRDLGDNGQAYMLARLSKGTAGAFDALLHHGKLSIRDGVYDADTSGGFIDRLGVPLHGELDDFLWYVAANRAEGLSRVDRENLFTPADIAAGKSLAKGQTNFDYTIQTGPQKGTTTRNRTMIYADANRVFNEFQKNALDMAEQSGLIDGASRKLWESEFYVPFYRVSEEDGEFIGAKMGNALVRQQAFKKLKGGTDKLNSDLLSNTLLNFSHLIEASAKNRAAKASLAAAEQIGAADRVAPDMASYTASNGAMLPPGTKGTVWFQENGKKVEYKVTDPFVMTAITSLEYAGMRNGVMDVMTKFKHYLTVGVTASPAFKVRNLIRDSLQAIGTSDLSYNPIKNVTEGFKQTKRGNQDYVSALASGGLIRFGTMLEGSESSRVRQLVKSGVKDSTILNSESKWRAFYDKVIDPGIEAYNELGNRSEEINRAALYNQLIKQGKSHAEAALLARDLMDFSMQGSFNTIRFLTQVVPFLNARLQGLYKLGRSAKDNPKKMAIVTGAVALASIALMLGYEDDDDWKRREDWDRDSFWWFKFGGIEYRIPKPFELGAVASLAERGLELMTNDEMTGERFRRVTSNLVLNQLSMNPIPQAFKPILDLYANKDSFTQRPIESTGMEKLDSTERFNSNTSMLARGLSNATFGALSPVQYDHLARAYFGWLGSFVVGGADMALRAMSNEPTRPALDYYKFATQGIAKEAGTGGSRYLTQMYEQATELEQAYSTYRHLLNDGKTEEAQQYREDNKDKLQRYRQVESVKRVESKLNEQIHRVERSEADADEKKAAIERIQRQKEIIAKRIAPGVVQGP